MFLRLKVQTEKKNEFIGKLTRQQFTNKLKFCKHSRTSKLLLHVCVRGRHREWLDVVGRIERESSGTLQDLGSLSQFPHAGLGAVGTLFSDEHILDEELSEVWVVPRVPLMFTLELGFQVHLKLERVLPLTHAINGIPLMFIKPNRDFPGLEILEETLYADWLATTAAQ